MNGFGRNMQEQTRFPMLFSVVPTGHGFSLGAYGDAPSSSKPLTPCFVPRHLHLFLYVCVHLQATGKQIVFVSRCIVVAFGILSGVLAIVLMKIGLSLGWVYLVSGWGQNTHNCRRLGDI
jgi:hypothetical protein